MGRILLVDDDARLRARICTLLAERMPDAQIVEAETADEARARGEECWSAVILDIRLGDDNGLEIVPCFGAKGHATPVLILSALPSDPYAIESARAGAAAYVEKDRADEELVAALRSALGGAR